MEPNEVPYRAASCSPATGPTRVAESVRGEVIGETVNPSADWVWAACDANHPFACTPGLRHICLKAGFDASRLYQVVYRSEETYVLGIGLAAWRDVGIFFKTAKADDAGTLNPVAGLVTHSIARGVSQAGNFLRGWLHLGLDQDETGKGGKDSRQVHDGLWPIIAGRRIALNFRWAQPDGVLELYQAGSEGPQHPQAHGQPEMNAQTAPCSTTSPTYACLCRCTDCCRAQMRYVPLSRRVRARRHRLAVMHPGSV
jgi:hypothetical protein